MARFILDICQRSIVIEAHGNGNGSRLDRPQWPWIV